VRTGKEVRTMLAEGNSAYVKSADHGLLARLAADGQAPRVAVLTCSDARVVPERVFDLPLGEAFVVRMPGNCVSDRSVLGSIEHAVSHLGVQAVVVLGHTDCGAVKGTLSCSCGEGLSSVVAEINRARSDLAQERAGDVVAVTRANVKLQMSALLERSPTIGDAVGSGHVELIGAMYDLSTGEVEFL
jgi:carbonic anhydrase